MSRTSRRTITPKRRRRTTLASTRPPRAGTERTCSRSPTTRTPPRRTSCSPRCFTRAAASATRRSSTSAPRTLTPSTTTPARPGYAALLAYAKHEEELSGSPRAEWHRRAIDSALKFAETYPAHVQAASVQTDAAEKLFALGEFGRARDVGRQVVARIAARRAHAAAHGLDRHRSLRVRSAGFRGRRDGLRAAIGAGAGRRSAA